MHITKTHAYEDAGSQSLEPLPGVVLPGAGRLPELTLHLGALRPARLLAEARVDRAHRVGDGRLLSVLLPVEFGPVLARQPVNKHPHVSLIAV